MALTLNEKFIISGMILLIYFFILPCEAGAQFVSTTNLNNTLMDKYGRHSVNAPVSNPSNIKTILSISGDNYVQ